MDDGAQHHADMLAFQEAAQGYLKKSLTQPLTADEVAMIAFVGGMDSKFLLELRHG